MDSGPFVVVEKLDGILNCDDVAGFHLIDVVKNGREC